MNRVVKLSICAALTAVMTVSSVSAAFAAEVFKNSSVKSDPGSKSSGALLIGPGSEEKVSEGTGISGKTDWSRVSEARRKLVEEAGKLVGGKYASGGNTPAGGLDCSGLVNYVLKDAARAAGITLARTSTEIATEGKEVALADIRPGDVICYDGDNKDGVVGHVAVYVGDGKIVHASGQARGVQKDSYNYEKPLYIRNVLGD